MFLLQTLSLWLYNLAQRSLQEPMLSHLFRTQHESQLIQISMAFLPEKLFRLWKNPLLETTQNLALSPMDTCKWTGRTIPSSSQHLASNASTEKRTATSIFVGTFGRRTWICGRIPEAWRCHTWEPGCSLLLAPLEEAIGSMNSKDVVSWSDDLVRAFQRAQQARQDTKTTHIPHPKDTLWIIYK